MAPFTEVLSESVRYLSMGAKQCHLIKAAGPDGHLAAWVLCILLSMRGAVSLSDKNEGRSHVTLMLGLIQIQRYV